MFYKVMTYRDGRLWSSCKSDNPDIAVEYSTDKIVYAPHGTKLFVFNDKGAAIDFAGCNQHIYQCEAIDAKKIRYLPAPSLARSYWENLQRYGISKASYSRIYFKDGSSTYTNMSFSNAFTVSALKLTNRVR